jgi:hypothetical protein
MPDRRDTNSEKPVSRTELTGSEGGQWLVSTRDSRYRLRKTERSAHVRAPARRP